MEEFILGLVIMSATSLILIKTGMVILKLIEGDFDEYELMDYVMAFLGGGLFYMVLVGFGCLSYMLGSYLMSM